MLRATRQSPLYPNGPKIRFLQEPVSISTTSDSQASFVGIATAEFTDNPEFIPDGTLSYRWHEVNSEGSQVALSDSSSIAGSATTTLTILNTRTPQDNNKRFVLVVDYISSAYSQPAGSAITSETARFTGKAENSPIVSGISTLTVFPNISITLNPESRTTGVGGDAFFTVEAVTTDSSFGDLSYQWKSNGANLSDRTSSPVISGSNTQIVYISPSTVGISTIQSIVSKTISSNGSTFTTSVTSGIATLTTVAARQLLSFEAYNTRNNQSIIRTTETNLSSTYTLNDSIFSQCDTISFFAPETDFDLEIEMFAAKGADASSYTGGNGGYGRFYFRINRDIEYTILGISNNSALFLYRGSTLIAVVGKGGNAGINGNGGTGGGIGRVGGNGFGSGAGSGGQLISSGQLTTTGIYGSNSPSGRTLLSGDTRATEPNGGRTISCPKGQYWLSQGRSPCDSLGVTQFYTYSGVRIAESSLITRGFKQGYSVTETGGLGRNSGGNGGEGATGGSGGTSGAGGGGGSGYTDGSITILTTTSGSNSSTRSYMTFKVYVPPPPAPAPPPPPPPTPPPPSPGGGSCCDTYVRYRYGGVSGDCPKDVYTRKGRWYTPTSNFNGPFPIVSLCRGNFGTVQNAFVEALNRPANPSESERYVSLASSQGYGAVLNRIKSDYAAERNSIIRNGVFIRGYPTTSCGRSYNSIPADIQCETTGQFTTSSAQNYCG